MEGGKEGGKKEREREGEEEKEGRACSGGGTEVISEGFSISLHFETNSPNLDLADRLGRLADQ